MNINRYLTTSHISDHLPVVTYIYPSTPSQTYNTSPKRKNTKSEEALNLEETIKSLKDHDWNAWHNSNKDSTSDEIFDSIQNIITSTTTTNTQITITKKRYKPLTPWISQATLKKDSTAINSGKSS